MTSDHQSFYCARRDYTAITVSTHRLQVHLVPQYVSHIPISQGSVATSLT